MKLLQASLLFSAGFTALFAPSAQAGEHRPPSHRPPSVTNNNTNISPSANSNATNTSTNSVDSDFSNSSELNAITISNTNDQHFGFSSGAKLPSTQLNFNYVNREGEDIIQAGVSIPLGVKKSTILKDVERTHQLEEAKFCLDLVRSGVSLGSERMAFFDCDGFTYPEITLVPTLPEPPSDYEQLKDSINSYKNEIKKAQELNAALLERINQLQAKPTLDKIGG